MGYERTDGLQVAQKRTMISHRQAMLQTIVIHSQGIFIIPQLYGMKSEHFC